MRGQAPRTAAPRRFRRAPRRTREGRTRRADVPLDKKDTSKDISILMHENRERARKGKKPRSRAQIIAIALHETGKNRRKY